MDIKYIGDNIIEIDGKVRIEVGPARFKAIATKELLDDKVTAAHYQVGLPDALGKPIELGKEFTYIDWKGLSAPVHYIYALEAVDETDDKGKKSTINRWMPKGSKPSEAEALSAAVTMAAALPPVPASKAA
jgi:hypothetical protein